MISHIELFLGAYSVIYDYIFNFFLIENLVRPVEPVQPVAVPSRYPVRFLKHWWKSKPNSFRSTSPHDTLNQEIMPGLGTIQWNSEVLAPTFLNKYLLSLKFQIGKILSHFCWATIKIKSDCSSWDTHFKQHTQGHTHVEAIGVTWHHKYVKNKICKLRSIVEGSVFGWNMYHSTTEAGFKSREDLFILLTPQIIFHGFAAGHTHNIERMES